MSVHVWWEEWEREPDEIAIWFDPLTHFPCYMRRNTVVSGTWCGYVGVKQQHPWYHARYTDCVDPECGDSDCRAHEHSPFSVIEVHGGLTFSSFLNYDEEYWWFGFDCAHAGDFSPMYSDQYELQSIMPIVYRNVAYVQEQIRRLAIQLRKVNE